MDQFHSIGIWASFLAGLLSFFSPCVLPLIPVYISLISGFSVEALESGEKAPVWISISRTLVFIAGFSTVFILLGAGAGAAGQVFRTYSAALRMAGGVVVIVFGLHLTGLLPISLLYREKRFSFAARQLGLVGVFLMGMTFALGWTPCVGPILACILTLAASEGHTGRGIALLLAYSAGMGAPFLLAAAALGSFLKLSSRIKKTLRGIEIGSGILLIILGILLLTDRFSVIARWLARIYTPSV